MVSTRGVKLKFFEHEKVLCYEPDPTKAKVLYDSKVLQVIVNKDPRGRKSTEYLIHFQGWNSSWDRCVSEDFVLKDTPENRQLQKDLAEKAQLQIGAYLYRRERKKCKERKLSERQASSEDGSSSPAHMDTDDADADVVAASSSDADESNSSEEEGDVGVPLELPPPLKHALDHDYYLVCSKQKLLQLPAEPNVVAILEKYWKYYVNRELGKICDKPNTRNRNSIYGNSLLKHKPEHIQKNINTCKELVDGLRVYFDYTLSDLLLYDKERDQVVLAQATELSICPNIKSEMGSSPEHVKSESDDTEYAHLPSFDATRLSLDERPDLSDTPSHVPPILTLAPPTKRRLRSHRSVDSSATNNSDCNGNGDGFVKGEVLGKGDIIGDNQGTFGRSLEWGLLPEHVYNQEPPPPCLVYGATHLTRLLVKLPDLLYASNMAVDKLKTLLSHLESFVEFLSEHKEWFGDKHYIDSNLPN